MIVLFLDFDGVIVTSAAYWPQPHLLGRLNNILTATDASVVVSSAWRLHYSAEELRSILGDEVGKRVVGVTPRQHPWLSLRLTDERPAEIRSWLGTHHSVSSFAVLDDVDMGKAFGHRMIHVHRGWETGGLQDKHVERAIKALRVR